MAAVVVAEGTWLYDGTAPTPVLIVRCDWDFWYAIREADGEIETGESPRLNQDGYAYYVRLAPGWSEGKPFWPHGPGYMTVEEAKSAAEEAVPSPVHWRG